jgi:hypothetical protein
MMVMQTQQHQCGPHGGYQRYIKVMLVSALFSSFVQELIWTLQDKQNNPRLSVTMQIIFPRQESSPFSTSF